MNKQGDVTEDVLCVKKAIISTIICSLYVSEVSASSKQSKAFNPFDATSLILYPLKT